MQLIKPSAYAKLRGLNKSTVSRQIAAGVIPLHDGLIDPVEADASRDRNLCHSHRAAAKFKKDMAGAPTAEVVPAMAPAAPVDRVGAERAGMASAIRRVAAPAQALAFARIALRCGCTRLQAFVVASWHTMLSALAVDELDDSVLATIKEPTEEEWRTLLGDFDFDRAWVAVDRAGHEPGVQQDDVVALRTGARKGER
jgi:hypothetical protein